MEQKEKIERLKELIAGSASFSDVDKQKLIAKIPGLTTEAMDEAIRVFEEEIEDWKAIYKKHGENKAMLFRFMDESQRNISQMSHRLIKKAENGEHAAEETAAEDLLKTIK
ncbi:MAG: hypothetical protein V1880_02745 [Patescibacteria group bacterium]